MAKKSSYANEVKAHLRDRRAFDRSKHQDKITDKKYIDSLGPAPLDRANLLEKKYFYSRKTYKECVRKGAEVLHFCKDKYGKRIDFSDVSEADLIDYMAERRKLAENGEITPRTLAKERAQVSKVFLVDLVGKVDILPCTAESDKGRGDDANWGPKKHPQEVEFWSMVGARKNEYHYLDTNEIRYYGARFEQMYGQKPATDIHGRVCNIQPLYMDGEIAAVCIMHAKHGKTNVSEILPENRARLTEIWRGGVDQFMDPPDHANVHQCRRNYAQALYAHYRRDVLTLPEKELYRCRDGSHRIYDRLAVARVAVSLGHREGDLYDTIHNYLR